MKDVLSALAGAVEKVDGGAVEKVGHRISLHQVTVDRCKDA
jgi:hypothetical protein